MSEHDNNDSTPEVIEPWYKQFWPWFIIAFPLAAVIAGINMIILSIDGADDLVKTNYYKDGLAINQQFERRDKAIELGIVADMTITNERVMITLQSHKPMTEPLLLDFQHATSEDYDFTLKLQQRHDGSYFAPLDSQLEIKAKWYVELRPYSETWLLKDAWQLPSSDVLRLGTP